MNTITFGKKSFQIPGNWNELTSAQLILLAQAFGTSAELEEIKIKLLFYFTGIRVLRKKSITVDNQPCYWLKYKNKSFIVPAYSLSFVTKPFISFFKQENEAFIINPLLTRQLLPEIKISFRKQIYGPSDGLSNLTFAEFIHAETAYAQYLKTNDEKQIDRLIAILYRPAGKIKPGDKNWNGDIREPFNDYLIDEYAGALLKINPTLKRAIRWYYEGCKVHISQLFPFVFKKGQGSGQQSDTFRNFISIVDELAGNNPAEHDRIMHVQLYTALNSLNQRIEKTYKHG